MKTDPFRNYKLEKVKKDFQLVFEKLTLDENKPSFLILSSALYNSVIFGHRTTRCNWNLMVDFQLTVINAFKIGNSTFNVTVDSIRFQ